MGAPEPAAAACAVSFPGRLRFAGGCFLFCLMCFWLLPFASLAAADAADVFPRVYERVDKFLDLTSRYDRAEEDGWLPKPFSDTKSSVSGEINKLLDDVLLTLGDDRLVALKKEINALNAENSRLAERIGDLSMRRLAAPEDTKKYEIWKSSADEIGEKIQRARRDIAGNESKIDQNKTLIRKLLAENGLKMSEAEVDSLLKTVTGDDVIEATAVLKNVHSIVARLQKMMKSEDENIHLAKKYYGLYLLATRAYYRQLELFSERIEGQYLPKLAEIRADNRKLMDETRTLAREDARYEANLKAQAVTEKAAAKYEQVLKSQKLKIEARKGEVGKILTYAENTYKTVTLAHSLFNSMNEGLASYEALMSLTMIEAVPFENKDLELKFQELTQKMAH